MHIHFRSRGRKHHTAKKTLMALAGGLSLACSAHDGGSGEELPGGPADNGSASSAPATGGQSTLAAAAPVVVAPAHHYAIDLGGEHKVTYSLFEDGSLLVSEFGNKAADDPVGEAVSGMTPAEAFRSLKPGQAVPAEFLEAEPLFAPQPAVDNDVAANVAEAARPVLPDRAYAPAFDGLLPKAGNSDANVFKSIFGCFSGTDDRVHLCLTNSFDWANFPDDARWAMYKVLPFVGSVVVQINLAGQLRALYVVPQDNFNFNRARGPLKKHTQFKPFGQSIEKVYPDVAHHQFQIVNSVGSQFHLGIRTHNYQTSGPNCAEIWSVDQSTWVAAGTAVSDCSNNHYGTWPGVIMP